MRFRGLRPLLGPFAALFLAAILAVASTLGVLSSAVSALFLLLLPLRYGFFAGYKRNQLSDKSKSHLVFL